MTMREAGELILKVMGVGYFLVAAEWLIELIVLVAYPRHLSAGYEAVDAAAVLRTGLYLLVQLAIAILLVQHSRRLSRLLFKGEGGSLEVGVSARRLLLVGICLVGAWVAVRDLGFVLNDLVDVLWVAGGERRILHGAELADPIRSGLKSLIFVALGGGLLWFGLGRLSSEAEENEAAAAKFS